jgi:hypothetical protein
LITHHKKYNLTAFKNVYILFFCLIYCISANAQIIISGKTIRKDSTFYNIDQVMVINKRTNTGVFSDIKGNFTINADSHTVIIFKKLGFETDTLKVWNSWNLIKNNRIYIDIYMKVKPIMLPSFTFNYKHVSIDPVERRKEWSYVLDRSHASAQSPITALYQQFSKKGKELRKLEALYYEDEKRRYMEERFSRFKAVLLTGLAGKDLDGFLFFCRPSYELMMMYNDYELYTRINQCYEEYKLLHPEILDRINYKRRVIDSTDIVK